MDDNGSPNDVREDFLMPDQGPGVDAKNFQIERPSGTFSEQAAPKNTPQVAESQREVDQKLANVRDELAKAREQEPFGPETVLIFGQGPVITEPHERINYWSKDLAKAGATLYKSNEKFGRKTRFVVLGGKTGGEDHSSEANLIDKEMEELGIPQDAREREELSNDTIENIVNYLNMFDEGGDVNKKVSILCAPYHSARTQVITQLFRVNVENVYQSTELERYAARLPEGATMPTLDSEKWDHGKLQNLEDMVDINDPTKFSSKQSLREQRAVDDRYVKDDMWTRELLEYPEKWLPYVGKLNNGERIKAILAQFEELYPDQLRDKFGITVPDSFDEATLADIKTKLGNIPEYQGLSPDTVAAWEQQNRSVGWPEQTKERLHKLLNMRQQHIKNLTA